MEKEKGKFTSSLGFILTAAGSAVGIGNIWRFPYLAAKDGGGVFLLVYLILFFTLGFTLLSTDVAIGRKTRKNSLKAYGSINRKWNFLGIITFIVPLIIMTYYTVIGSWVLKYAVGYLTGSSKELAQDTYFTNFITDIKEPVIYNIIFLFITAVIVYKGIEKGIEKFSKIIMPDLVFIIIGIAIYTLTLSYTTPEGITRTAKEGLAIYLTPNFSGMNFGRFMEILVDAMSQIFFSLSVSMGIMITFGSYVDDKTNLGKSVSRIQGFDTIVAFLSGAIIIPAIYVFSGEGAFNYGPGLMFVSLPKIFLNMGTAGKIVGPVFFIMVIFATLTSCISILETIVANFQEITGASRKKITVIAGISYTLLSTIICLGYNVFYINIGLPNGSSAQLLDLMDYISNSCLMPFIALLSSIFIGWVVKPKYITSEMEKNGDGFKGKAIYNFTIKYVAPAFMLILFLQSTGTLERIASL